MLSDYSSRSLAIILAALPDLAVLIAERGEAFEAAAKSPSGLDFWLSSDDEELTVGLAEYHCHFGGYSESTPEGDAIAAVDFIKALRSGETVIAAWYIGDKYVGSQSVSSQEEPQPFKSGKQQVLKVRKWAA